MERVIKRVAIFDFDGTLIDTPSPEVAKVGYEIATGNPWPHTGFWSKKESLDGDMFDMPVIESVYEAYKKERERKDTLCVMMTGRIVKLSKIVEKILQEKGMLFDEYQYKSGRFGPDTLDFKLGMMAEYLERFPELESMAMWEDRQEHAGPFQVWGESQKNLIFEITTVINTRFL